MENNKTIFKVGDKVFDYQFGWGKVVIVEDCPTYPIKVQFGTRLLLFTDCGMPNANMKYPSLSFTEYDFVNGGFSQERPIEVPKRGQIVWVRDYKDVEDWKISHFLRMKGLFFLVSITNNEDNSSYWKYLTTENPYENAKS